MSPPKAVVAFTLPKNTIKFSYYLEVSQEGVDKYKESINNLSNRSASLLSSFDPMLGLLLTGVSTIGTISGGEDVQFYLVENTQFISNSNLFLTDQPFQAIRNSKVYNDASVIDLLAGKNINGNWAFCLYNDNVVQSIDVALKVKAMCAKAKTIIQKTVPIIE
jgi:alpha-D-ribose 1-methylphosphonate 5-triphosphate synthase subunit PhnL